ncbi:MAG TPA: phosphatase PAP2 family protein [Gemmatimonadales bacterium]|nr:phosphatase PAP2 family protein [Gemmatimonadales bacterium]
MDSVPDTVELSSPAGAAGRGGSTLGLYVWRELRLLVYIGALSLGLAIVVRYVLDYPIPLTRITVPDRMLKVLRYALVLGMVMAGLALVRQRRTLARGSGSSSADARPWRAALGALQRDELTARLVLAGATCVLMAVLLSVFAIWKASIPYLSPWHWDVTLVGIERALHGGQVPQDLTRRWLGRDATIFLDRLYYLWFRLLALFVVWQSFRRPSASRTRTLLAMVLAYVLLGNLAAVLLSSGGPVYYDRLISGPSPYAAQTAYLATIPGLHAVEIQHLIWQWLLTDHYIPFGSISAMPSMHVAVATIMALACWERDRRLGLVAWAYALLILVGSVHLNWHYAVDGYVAILGTIAVWRISAWLVGRYA